VSMVLTELMRPARGDS